MRGSARCPIIPSSSARAPSSTRGCCPRSNSARWRRRRARQPAPRPHRRAFSRPGSSRRLTQHTRPEEQPVEAVVTRPVFSATHQLILPAGARLTGKVTFVKQARHFRRNGQLRFLFDSVHVPGRESRRCSRRCIPWKQAGPTGSRSTRRGARRSRTRRPGSLRPPSAHSRWSDSHKATSTTTQMVRGPKWRTVAHSAAAWRTRRREHHGAAVSSLGHPAAVALGVLGVARTTYTGVIGKGREVAIRN